MHAGGFQMELGQIDVQDSKHLSEMISVLPSHCVCRDISKCGDTPSGSEAMDSSVHPQE